jgi:hypothetical protein
MTGFSYKKLMRKDRVLLSTRDRIVIFAYWHIAQFFIEQWYNTVCDFPIPVMELPTP